MNKKYYTPTINEFHIGYEFQFACTVTVDGINKKDDWIDDKIETPEDINRVFERSELMTEFFRSKLLDEEDIKSLGWTWDESNRFFGLSDYKMTGQISHQNLLIEKYQEDYPMGEHTSWYDIKFEGKVKNKTELKKLMEQIGIKC